MTKFTKETLYHFDDQEGEQDHYYLRLSGGGWTMHCRLNQHIHYRVAITDAGPVLALPDDPEHLCEPTMQEELSRSVIASNMQDVLQRVGMPEDAGSTFVNQRCKKNCHEAL